MPRPLRIEYAGACYHLMSRGDRRENIFLDEADRERFLELLGKVCGKNGWEVHAYCLMSNHWHAVVDAAAQFGGGDALAAGNLYAKL